VLPHKMTAQVAAFQFIDFSVPPTAAWVVDSPLGVSEIFQHQTT
jgi:hypothetical protein